MKRNIRHSGFTLLELVLVMLIASVALAVAAPSLRSWRNGNTLRNSAEDLLTLTRYARTQSITDAVVYRLNFDVERNFWLTKSKSNASHDEFEELGNDFGQKQKFGDGVLFVLNKVGITNEAQNAAADSIDFYPTGRTQPADITLTDSFGNSIKIVCDAPAENFRIMAEGQGIR